MSILCALHVAIINLFLKELSHDTWSSANKKLKYG